MERGGCGHLQAPEPSHTCSAPPPKTSPSSRVLLLDAALEPRRISLKQISSHKYIDFSQLTLTQLQGSLFLYFDSS